MSGIRNARSTPASPLSSPVTDGGGGPPRGGSEGALRSEGNERSTVRPVDRLEGLRPYAHPPKVHEIDLWLDLNEGPGPSDAVLDAIARVTPETIRRYPDASPLEARLAARLGVDPSCVLVTNGGDDSIDRATRAVLEPGRSALLHTPTFEMIPRGVRLAGATPVEISWRDDAFPAQAFLDAIAAHDPSMIALVTPNNPTGGVIPVDNLLAIANAAPSALVLVDLAYVEFDDDDPTPALLDVPNVMMVRTFSKARGLAGLRVGYAVAPAPIIRLLRTTGGPFPVSPLSIAAASAALDEADLIERTVARVRTERGELMDLLTRLGARPMPSKANFVTADFSSCGVPCATAVPAVLPAEQVRDELAQRGIAVRGWPGRAGLEGLLRITLPANERDFARLTGALTQILAPQTGGTDR